MPPDKSLSWSRSGGTWPSADQLTVIPVCVCVSACGCACVLNFTIVCIVPLIWHFYSSVYLCVSQVFVIVFNVRVCGCMLYKK